MSRYSYTVDYSFKPPPLCIYIIYVCYLTVFFGDIELNKQQNTSHSQLCKFTSLTLCDKHIQFHSHVKKEQDTRFASLTRNWGKNHKVIVRTLIVTHLLNISNVTLKFTHRLNETYDVAKYKISSPTLFDKTAITQQTKGVASILV